MKIAVGSGPNLAARMARLYIAPEIWMDPFFSKSANTGLRRRMFSTANMTLVRASAST